MISKLCQINETILDFKADRNYINVPIRPPVKSWIEIPSSLNLHEAQEILNTENIIHYEEILVRSENKETTSEELRLEITGRNPLREDQFHLFFQIYLKETS
ncbi:MAG: hypothetical protein HGN29_15195 [Asgard group archaeon]|nr:hypothetical protein [Asgard group archaeon]